MYSPNSRIWFSFFVNLRVFCMMQTRVGFATNRCSRKAHEHSEVTITPFQELAIYIELWSKTFFPLCNLYIQPKRAFLKMVQSSIQARMKPTRLINPKTIPLLSRLSMTQSKGYCIIMYKSKCGYHYFILFLGIGRQLFQSPMGETYCSINGRKRDIRGYRQLTNQIAKRESSVWSVPANSFRIPGMEQVPDNFGKWCQIHQQQDRRFQPRFTLYAKAIASRRLGPSSRSVLEGRSL